MTDVLLFIVLAAGIVTLLTLGMRAIGATKDEERNDQHAED